MPSIDDIENEPEEPIDVEAVDRMTDDLDRFVREEFGGWDGVEATLRNMDGKLLASVAIPPEFIGDDEDDAPESVVWWQRVIVYGPPAVLLFAAGYFFGRRKR